MKHLKALTIILVLVLAVSLVSGCGGKSIPAGTYVCDSVSIEIRFDNSGKYTWHESGMVFNGSYKIDGDFYILTTQGSGLLYPTQEFSAYFEGDDLMINVYNASRRFVKE